MSPALDGGTEIAEPACRAYCMFLLFTAPNAKTLCCGPTTFDVYTPGVVVSCFYFTEYKEL